MRIASLRTMLPFVRGKAVGSKLIAVFRISCRPSLRMCTEELSFESLPSLRVTWTIPGIRRLATESDRSLRSPDFTLADGRHYLRLYQIRDCGFYCAGIELMNSNDADPGRADLYEVQFKSTTSEIDLSRDVKNQRVFHLLRSYLEDLRRDVCGPDDTLTVLCSVLSREPGSGGSPESGGARTRVIPQYRMTGNLSSEPFLFLHVTWRIPAFFQLPRGCGCDLSSPEFPFSDGRYRLRLVPHEEHFDIDLENSTDPVLVRYVSYAAGLKSTTGEEIYSGGRHTPTKLAFHILRSELDAMQPVRFPDGHLTVFCYMRSSEPSSGGSPKSVEAETSNEEPLPGGVAKLLSDYKQLLLKGAESDACLVVCDREFQVHRNVLRARSPVFEAMFDHETAEKASGRVVIDDLKPDRFHDFLEYLYTGRVESFSEDNAFGLYTAADKYDVPTLKSECVEYMRRSLSVDNFCDVITLALRHHEEDLLEHSVEFFKKNVAGIILTVKWQQFMSENSTIANELFVKLHVPGRESENVLLP